MFFMMEPSMWKSSIITYEIWLKNAVELKYICIEERTTKILTKLLPSVKFYYFGDKLGIVENDALAEREYQLHEFLCILLTSFSVM